MRYFWLNLAAIPLLAAPLSVTELTEHALDNDNELKAERARIEHAFHQKEAVRMWENPELSLLYSRTKPDGVPQEGEYGVALTQAVEKPSLKTAKERAAEARILQAKALVLHRENEVKGEVRQKAYLFSIASLMGKKAEESYALASSLRQKGEKRFEQGAISKADLLKLQLEEEKSQQELQSALMKREGAKSALALSAQFTPEYDFDPVTLPKPEPVRLRESLDTLPMISYYKAVEEELREQKSVVEKSVIPGFKAGIGYQQMYDQKALTASLSMPIPLLNRNEPLLKEVQSRLNENRLREQSYRFTTEQKIARYQKMIGHLSQRIVSQENVILQATKMVSMALRSYEEGYGTLLELLDARRTLVNHQQEMLNNLEMYYDTLGELEKTFPQIEEK